jgi:hypothetical protein
MNEAYFAVFRSATYGARGCFLPFPRTALRLSWAIFAASIREAYCAVHFLLNSYRESFAQDDSFLGDRGIHWKNLCSRAFFWRG